MSTISVDIPVLQPVDEQRASASVVAAPAIAKLERNATLDAARVMAALGLVWVHNAVIFQPISRAGPLWHIVFCPGSDLFPVSPAWLIAKAELSGLFTQAVSAALHSLRGLELDLSADPRCEAAVHSRDAAGNGLEPIHRRDVDAVLVPAVHPGCLSDLFSPAAGF